jgi:putative PIN family toxin of toxin-antitoxin system
VRVVFDTNVFVSALATPGSRAEHAIERVLDGQDRLVVSKAIIDEVLGVLARKFSRDREELARVAVLVADLGEMIEPDERLSVLDDEADNRILECAVSGRAEVIVTGDRAFLALGRFRDVRVVRLSEYLAMAG